MTSMITRTFETTRRRAVRRKLRRVIATLHHRVRSPARIFAFLCLSLILLCLAGLAAIQASGVRTWPIELVHHFVAHAGFAAAGVAVAAAALRFSLLLLPASVLAAWFTVIWASGPLPAAGAAGDQASAGTGGQVPLTLITSNVYVNNDQTDALVAWLASQPADVVILQEVAPHLIERIHRRDDGYAHRVVGEDIYVYDGGETTEAIAVLSRLPIIESRRLNAQTLGWQAMLLRLDAGDGGKPWIVAIHPPSPIFKRGLPVRDRILRDLAGVIPTLGGPVIVAGDFNATPYTPVFRDFVSAAGVATYRSLPATFPDVLGMAGLPIDHVMVRDARLAKLQGLPSIGSDHRMLSATVLLPAE